MASKPNADIGTVDCPVQGCGATARIRKMVNGRRAGKLYVHCSECGPVMARGQRFQDWLLDRASMNGPKAPPPEPHTPKPAEAVTADGPAPQKTAPASDAGKKPFSLW